MGGPTGGLVISRLGAAIAVAANSITSAIIVSAACFMVFPFLFLVRFTGMDGTGAGRTPLNHPEPRFLENFVPLEETKVRGDA
jgi:hypothetical protein